MSCDITHSTNSEIGFDYLRITWSFALKTWYNVRLTMPWSMRVDSILIDEARTPLIVSGANAVETSQLLSHGRPLCQIFEQRRLYHRCAV